MSNPSVVAVLSLVAISWSASIATAGERFDPVSERSMILVQEGPNTDQAPAGAAQITDPGQSTVTVASARADLIGTIEAVDGSLVSVSSTGGVLKFKLADHVVVGAVSAATLAEIKPNDTVGINRDEIYILPSKGPWTVVAVEAQMLKIKYPDAGETRNVNIPVTPRTSIFRITPASMTDLKPGVKIFSSLYQKLGDGTIEVQSISFGEKGIAPHMAP
jgi:hypothetical protein